MLTDDRTRQIKAELQRDQELIYPARAGVLVRRGQSLTAPGQDLTASRAGQDGVTTGRRSRHPRS